MDNAERRRYKRMFFSIEEGPVAVFTVPDSKGRIFTAIIMDLSPGGLGLSVKKDENIIKPGECLILAEIKGTKGLESVKDIETEVKWIQNFKAFKHILLGCEFLNITEAQKEDIQSAINLWTL